MVWSIKIEVMSKILDIRVILVYDSIDCFEIEDFIYMFFDIVVEVMREMFKRKVYVMKGFEFEVFDFFEGDEYD